MKSVILPSLLALWLVASVGLWLLGVGFSGEWVPPVNIGTLLVLYAPWIILLTLTSAAWVNRKKNGQNAQN